MGRQRGGLMDTFKAGVALEAATTISEGKHFPRPTPKTVWENPEKMG